MPNPLVTTPSYEQSLQGRVDRLERELTATQARLAHAQRLAALGTSAAGLAHELNNILTPVLAYAQLAQSSPNDLAIHRKSVLKTAHGVRFATELASSMLAFARPTSTSQDDVADVNDAVRQATQCLVRDPARDGIECELHIGDCTYVQMRPVALQQVILNLLLNAIKALRTVRQRRITIAADRSDETTVVLRISDTGPGIPATVSRRLFEPFVHHGDDSLEHHATSDTHADTDTDADDLTDRPGLGLAICRMLIDQAGGSIAVTSSPDRGTTFTIELPAATMPSSSPQITA